MIRSAGFQAALALLGPDSSARGAPFGGLFACRAPRPEGANRSTM
jgi:hypothetical protein